MIIARILKLGVGRIEVDRCGFPAVLLSMSSSALCEKLRPALVPISSRYVHARKKMYRSRPCCTDVPREKTVRVGEVDDPEAQFITSAIRRRLFEQPSRCCPIGSDNMNHPIALRPPRFFLF